MLTLLVFFGIFLLALLSPGPDFFIVLKNALNNSRRVAIATSLGVALGCGVHIAYSLAGIGLIISQSILLFNIIKYIGAAYLLYLAYQLFKAGKEEIKVEKVKQERTLWSGFVEGFLTNVLNPKATIFFVSFISQFLTIEPSVFLQISFGVGMITIAFIYFSLISIVLQRPSVKKGFEKSQGVVNKIFGGLLAFMGIKLFVSD